MHIENWMAGPFRISAFLFLICITLYIVDPISMISYLYSSIDINYLNGDSRQFIWPYMSYWDEGLFQSDYIANYYLTALSPKFYSLAMSSMAGVVDPRVLSNVLARILYGATSVFVILAALKLGGRVAMWCAIVLFFGSDIFAVYTAGGLPRSFGFPLIALTAYGLVSGRPVLIVVSILLGAMFYYVSAVLSGCVLFAYLIMTPRSWRGDALPWGFPRRALMLTVVGALAIGLIAVSAFGAENYGPIVTAADYDRFPEAGPAGRYYPPTENVLVSAARWSMKVLEGSDPLFPDIQSFIFSHFWLLGVPLLLVCLPGLGSGLRENGVRRLLILPLVSVLLYLAAEVLMPYLYFPQRYMIYSMPVFAVLMIPCCLSYSIRRFGLVPNFKNAGGFLAVGICLLLIALTGGRNSGAGLIHIKEKDEPIYSFISQLPKDALIAGWPRGLLDNVPYATGRRVLLTYETHQGFHEGYIVETRFRMKSIITAYNDPCPKALVDLRENFGVTHFVVDESYFAEGLPNYFMPFQDMISAAADERSEEPFLNQASGQLEVFRHGDFVILDLTKISTSQPCFDFSQQ